MIEDSKKNFKKKGKKEKKKKKQTKREKKALDTRSGRSQGENRCEYVLLSVSHSMSPVFYKALGVRKEKKSLLSLFLRSTPSKSLTRARSDSLLVVYHTKNPNTPPETSKVVEKKEEKKEKN